MEHSGSEEKIRLLCACGARLVAPLRLLGKQISCPQCDRLVSVARDDPDDLSEEPEMLRNDREPIIDRTRSSSPPARANYEPRERWGNPPPIRRRPAGLRFIPRRFARRSPGAAPQKSRKGLSGFKGCLIIGAAAFGALIVFGALLRAIFPSLAEKEKQLATAPKLITPSERLEEAKRKVEYFSTMSDLLKAEELLKGIPPTAAESRDAKSLLAQVAEHKQDVALLGPRPINSGWDSSVREVDQYLKKNVNDYGSIEYIEWSRVVPYGLGERYWVVRCKFRGANVFGGKVIAEKLFLIRHGQVVKVQNWQR